MAPRPSIRPSGGRRTADHISGFGAAAWSGAAPKIHGQSDDGIPTNDHPPDKIAAFVDVMRANVLTGDTPFRRAYIRSVIDQVEVDDTEIRIVGRRQVLERLMTGGGHLRPECPVLSGSGAPEEMRTPDPRFVVTSYDYRLDIGQSPRLYHGQDTSVRLLGGAALGRPSDRVPCRAVAHSIPCAASFRMAGVGALGSRAYKQDWTYSKAAENRVMDTGHVAKACLYCRQKSRNILILLSADPSRRERQWSRDAEAGG
jgi:hypothetical protein